jgi:hypothetical protein
MSQVRKKGIHGSRVGSSSPAIRHRTSLPSGQVREPAATAREPGRDGVDVIALDGHDQPALALIRHRQYQPAERRRLGVGAVDDAHKLDVLIAERQDPVGRPEPDVVSADDRVQAELLPEAHGGLVQVADRIGDVIEPEHDRTLPDDAT